MRRLFFLFLSSSLFAEVQDAVPPPPNYEPAFGKMLITLFGLIILIFLTVWMLRRLSGRGLGKSAPGRTIQILEKRSLSHKSVLYLIEVEGKRLLIAESQLEVRALTSLASEKNSNP